MKRASILSGVSGTGKTHTRTTDPELKDLPHLDIAEVYREFPEFDWSEALGCLLKRARKMLQEHDTIVIEGHFLPGSTTRKMLVDDLKVAGAKVDVRWFWVPLEVCVQRISDQWERGEISAAECRRRIELLRDCWKPQDPLTRDDVTWEELGRGFKAAVENDVAGLLDLLQRWIDAREEVRGTCLMQHSEVC